MEFAINGDLIFEKKHFTCQDLNRLEANISNYIGDQGIIEDREVIGVAMKRSPLQICTFFFLLKAHIPFMPMDITQPKKRLETMLETAGVSKIIVSSDEVLELNDAKKIILNEKDLQEEKSAKNICFSSESAYILCTSGTTGKPKAVEVLRAGLENVFEAYVDILKLDNNTIIAAFTNFTFDISFMESVLSLQIGGTMILANEEESKNPRDMARLLSEYEVNFLQITPSRLKMIQLLDPEFKNFQHIEKIVVGGEAMEKQLLHDIKQHLTVEIYNFYGPTETTIWSTVSNLTNKEEIDIGQPIRETRIYILNENLLPVEKGETGEICIGGLGLAKGYVNNEQQTKRQFVNLPFGNGERIYRSGDLGAYNEKGDILCFGRIDSQIKLNGHRVELDDIEMNMNQLEGIELAVVCFDKERKQLVAFYKSTDNKVHDSGELNRLLTERLPDYMVPHKFVCVENFLYTMSGKMDRKALLASLGQEQNKKMTENVPEKVLQAIKKTLNGENNSVSQDTTLAEIGFDSIKYIEFIVELERAYDTELESRMMNYEGKNTLRNIIQKLDK